MKIKEDGLDFLLTQEQTHPALGVLLKVLGDTETFVQLIH